MILYKLIGYNEETQVYVNPNTGLPENLPSPPFAVTDSAPVNYELFDAPEDWAYYGSANDYLSLRYEVYSRIEIICGTDYANWSALSDIQKQVALAWSNIRIANSLGLTDYATKCGGLDIAMSYINTFLDKSYTAREMRYYNAFTIFGFAYMGKEQALKGENYARKDFVNAIYVDRGVMFVAEDGIDGLGDWILGSGSYTTTGLKQRIISGEFTLQGITVDDFCNKLIDILDNGNY